MKINKNALYIIEKLAEQNYEAYAVGGCVRDSLMGAAPQDWDICTSATPPQIIEIFGKKNTIPTGLKHGTVTVLAGTAPLEVTTFRRDGAYKDHRRPENVEFVSSLEHDLQRRDFTINAMAYSPITGLVDYFGGQRDIQNKTLRCVGVAKHRFSEDALRILRALRFMSRLGFAADAALETALHSQKHLLKDISAERIYAELKSIICGEYAENVLLKYSDVLAEVVPEIKAAVGFVQNNPHHDKDVWQHTARSVGTAENDMQVRLCMLFHDLGKPQCYTQDDGGIGHFYAHAAISEDIAHAALCRLKSDTKTRQEICRLVRWHDADIHPRKLLRWLNRLGEETLRRLISVKRADTMAQAAHLQEKRLQYLDTLEQNLHTLILHNACFKINDLAVTGHDLIAHGVPQGKQVGLLLARLLDCVLEGEVQNNKKQLLNKIRSWI